MTSGQPLVKGTPKYDVIVIFDSAGFSAIVPPGLNECQT